MDVLMIGIVTLIMVLVIVFARKIENALSESGFRSPESTEKLKQFIKKEFGVDIH